MKEKLRKLAKLIARPIRPVLDHELENRVRNLAGLVPINYTKPEDIFIAGYPKSGNTWMQHLVAGMLFGIDMRLVPDSLVQNLVPSVHDQHFYRRYLPFAVFSTHELPQQQHRRVVYLVRDGRDVMVSYFHYLAALQGAPPNFEDLVTNGNGLFPSQWHEHVTAWMKNPYKAEMITIRYEDLMADAVGALTTICEFAKLQRDPMTLETVARTCSFNMMREKENAFGWDDKYPWPKDKFFVRRGKVGSFKDEMPPTALAAFMQCSRDALKLTGYVTD